MAICGKIWDKTHSEKSNNTPFIAIIPCYIVSNLNPTLITTTQLFTTKDRDTVFNWYASTCNSTLQVGRVLHCYVTLVH